MVNKIALASIRIETLVSDGISIQLPRTKFTLAIYAESVLKGLKTAGRSGEMGIRLRS